MRLNIGMVFEVNLNSENLFLDELILETKKIFQENAVGEFLGFILENIDKQLCDSLVRASSDAQMPMSMRAFGTCCASPHFRRYRRRKSS